MEDIQGFVGQEGRDMPPQYVNSAICTIHGEALKRIEAKLDRLTTKFEGSNGTPGYDVRLARQEMISQALIFAVGVVFAGLVTIALWALFQRGHS